MEKKQQFSPVFFLPYLSSNVALASGGTRNVTRFDRNGVQSHDLHIITDDVEPFDGGVNWEFLPDPPSPPAYQWDRCEALKHLAICDALDSFARLISVRDVERAQRTVYRNEALLPDKREFAVVEEDFEEEFLSVVADRIERFVNFGHVVKRAHCNSAADRLRIAALYSPQALYMYELDLYDKRSVRLEGRVILQSGAEHNIRREHRDKVQREAAIKKAEKERKSVPKQEREHARKAGRELKEQIKEFKLQSGSSLALGAALGAFAALGARLLVKTTKAVDGFNSLIDGIKSIGENMKRIMSNLWIVPFVVVLRYFIGSWGNALAAGAIVRFMPSFIGQSLWSHISVFFPKGDVTTQTGFSGLARLMSVAFTFSVFRGRYSPLKAAEFCKRLGNVDRMANGWEAFINWTMSALEVLVNMVRGMFGKDKMELYQRTDKEAHRWSTRADEFLKLANTGQTLDPKSLDGAIALLQEGYGLKEAYRYTSVGKTLDPIVGRVSAAILPYLGSVAARNNFRFEPIACFLYGVPGVGKTLMAVPFVATLLMKSGLIELPCTTDDVTREIWQKGTSEYWQGYSGQKAIVFDDAFQNRSYTGDKDNDYFNMIKMCGSFSMPLNFADVESKGKIYFTSKLVFGTTNLSSIDAEARVVIQEPGAVARRINYGYELLVTDEFKKDGKLDYKKFCDEHDRVKREYVHGQDPMDLFPWHIWCVRKHDFVRGQSSGADVPLKTVMAEIAEEFKFRLKNHDVAKSNLDRMVEAFGTPIKLETGSFLGEKLPSLKQALREFRKEFAADRPLVGKFLAISLFAVGSVVAFKVIRSVLCMARDILSSFFGSKDSSVKVQSNHPRTVPRSTVQKIKLQSGSFYNRGTAGKVYANSYKMFNLDSPVFYGQIVFIQMELAVLPQHFAEAMRDAIKCGAAKTTDRICFQHVTNNAFSFERTIGQFLGYDSYSDRDCDISFVKFVGVRAHVSILHAFATKADISGAAGRAVSLNVAKIDVTYSGNNPVFGDVVHYMVHSQPSVAIGFNLKFGNRSMKQYFRYSDIHTVEGDCGAPLTLADGRDFNDRVFLGLHVASGARNTGYASILTRELVDTVLQTHFKAVMKDKFVEDIASRGVKMQCGEVSPFPNMGSFLPIGVLDKPIVICPKTKYYQTDLYGTLGEYTCRPAVLKSVVKDGERIWPMHNAVQPYASPLLNTVVPRLDDIVHRACARLTEETKDVCRRLYTFDEAVLGIPQDKFRSIPRNTAAGFPYVYDVRGGKKEFFGNDDVYDLTGGRAVDLRERVDFILEQAAGNNRLSHVYIDFLKDEIRPVAKVEAVATRLISSAPLDYVVAWRMMFGCFSSAVMRKNVKTGMAPGICCYADWPLLAEHLSAKGPAVFDGDFKAFDSSEHPVVHDAILEYINGWYADGPENARIRSVLWADLVHSRHVGGRGDNQSYVYQWNKSLPSGHPFTTIVNSLYALIALVACYVHITGDYRGFWDHVSPITYGDDNVVNVSERIKDVYNQVTVSRAMNEIFGMTYTSGNKGALLEPYTTLDKVTFLKRSFFADEVGWLCPLELDSFLYTHYWCKNRKLEKDIIVSVLENALEELSLHPRGQWDAHASDIAGLLSDVYHVTTKVCCKRESYQELVLSRTDDWY